MRDAGVPHRLDVVAGEPGLVTGDHGRDQAAADGPMRCTIRRAGLQRAAFGPVTSRKAGGGSSRVTAWGRRRWRSRSRRSR